MIFVSPYHILLQESSYKILKGNQNVGSSTEIVSLFEINFNHEPWQTFWLATLHLCSQIMTGTVRGAGFSVTNLHPSNKVVRTSSEAGNWSRGSDEGFLGKSAFVFPNGTMDKTDFHSQECPEAEHTVHHPWTQEASSATGPGGGTSWAADKHHANSQLPLPAVPLLMWLRFQSFCCTL